MRMNLVFRCCTLAVFLVSAAPAPAQPATQPTSQYPADQASVEGDRGMNRRGGRLRRDLPYFRPLSAEEEQRALDFAKNNMPNFSGLWQRLPAPPSDRRRRLPPRLQLAFRLLLDAERDDDKKLYDVLVKQMQLRDDFIGLLRERRAETTREKRDELRQEMREKAGEIVDSWLEQRTIRLEQLKRSLQEESATLNEDRADPAPLVDDQFQRLLEESQMFVNNVARIAPGTQPAGETPERAAPPGGSDRRRD